ncbi:MAG: T9SS type A sorting domain-containing protein [Bacteroidaceae bacterium]|nr:T9SS type A sorting domain-containing protein [Bacteroidaceae bacterium]
MNRKFQIIALCALLIGAPLSMRAEAMCDEVETEMTGVTLSVSGPRVSVRNADGETLEVYNLTGVMVASYHVDSDAKTIHLTVSKGCYIIKVGKVVRKVFIR